MKCRYCGSMESKVVDSRPNEDSTAIRRRRECIQCGRRFTTFERIEENPIMVVKRDGRREPFEREKIATGIRKACEKRPISTDVQNQMVERIVREVNNSLDSEVSTATLGELVMKQLKGVDEVAYVRFASVYKEFKDTQTFMEELQRLLDENAGACWTGRPLPKHTTRYGRTLPTVSREAWASTPCLPFRRGPRSTTASPPGSAA